MEKIHTVATQASGTSTLESRGKTITKAAKINEHAEGKNHEIMKNDVKDYYRGRYSRAGIKNRKRKAVRGQNEEYGTETKVQRLSLRRLMPCIMLE